MADFSDDADQLVLDAAYSEHGEGDGEEEFETDPARLVARQKQIDYGKNTLGYENYLKAVPKESRKRFGRDHDPPTPDITKKHSKKAWDGIVKAWRRHLHKFDDYKPDQQPAATPPEQTVDESMTMQQASGMSTHATAAASDSAHKNKRWRRTAAEAQQHRRASDVSQQRTPQQQQWRSDSVRTAGRGSHNRREVSPSRLDSSRGHSVPTGGRGSSRDWHWQQQPSGGSRYSSRYMDSETRDADNYRSRSERGIREHGKYNTARNSSSRTSSGYNSGRRGAAGSDYPRSNREEQSRRERDLDMERENKLQQQQQQQKASQQCDVETLGMSWADEVEEAEATGQISMGQDSRQCHNGGCAGDDGAAAIGGGAEEKRSQRGGSHQQLTPAKRSGAQSDAARRPLKPFQ